MKRYDKVRTYFYENLHIVLPLCITGLLYNAFMAFIPKIEGITIDLLLTADYKKILYSSLTLLGIVLFVQINRFFKRFLVRVFGNKITLKMRQVSFENLMNKDLSFFTNNTAGDILNKNVSDIYDSTEGIRKMTTEVFDTIVLLLGYIVSLFVMDYKLTLMICPFIILSVLAAHFMKKLVYKFNKEYKEYLSVYKEKTLSLLDNELYYRGFGSSSDYYKKFADDTKTLCNKNTKALLFQSSLEPIYSIIAWVGLFFIIYFGGKSVINEAYQIGTLSAFLSTYLLVSKKASKVGKVFNAYQGFKVSFVRCKEYLITEENKNVDYNLNGDYLVIDNASLKYSTFTLPNASFVANKGEVIGICGRVHCGKTSLLRAISGLYDYNGSITYAGVELKDLVKSKKQYIAYCLGEAKLFSDTIKNNITLNRDGNLDKAIEESKINTDLEELGGIDAMLSHSNSNISGGEQRRMELARAIYPNCDILLLDDPFSSVSSDMAIDMLDDIINGNDKIVLFVSNNKNLLKKASKVIFIDDKLYIDSYDNLLNNNNFKSLMED